MFDGSIRLPGDRRERLVNRVDSVQDWRDDADERMARGCVQTVHYAPKRIEVRTVETLAAVLAVDCGPFPDGAATLATRCGFRIPFRDNLTHGMDPIASEQSEASRRPCSSGGRKHCCGSGREVSLFPP